MRAPRLVASTTRPAQVFRRSAGEDLFPADLILAHNAAGVRAPMRRYSFWRTLLTAVETSFDALVAWTVHRATSSRWDHAAMVVDKDYLIEQWGDGIRKVPISRYPDLYVIRVPLDERGRQLAVQYMEREYNRHASYDWPGIVSLTVHALTGGRLIVRWAETHTCAELAARALEHGGYVWSIAPEFITPADLYATFVRRQWQDWMTLPPTAAILSRNAAHAAMFGKLNVMGMFSAGANAIRALIGPFIPFWGVQ